MARAQRALIFGVLGQDGSYLAEQLRADGYEVCGMHRGFAPGTRPDQQLMLTNLRNIGVRIVEGSILSRYHLRWTIDEFKPDEIYNLAAMTSPGASWAQPQPARLAEVNGIAVVRILEILRDLGSHARFVQASSSAVYDPYRYGLYGSSKLLAHDAVWGHRNELGMHASNAVLYSHTSVRQDPSFLARKITRGVAQIHLGIAKHLELSDLDARRDWGWAWDYARAMALMGRRSTPGDCAIYTGWSRSVREFVTAAFAAVGIGGDVRERYIKLPKGDCVTCRPSREVLPPVSTPAPAGWEPSVSFEGMIAAMVEHDVSRLKVS